ncbi:hypothetical protein SS50377_24674 [Spironucleus salmonicida]|uniref:Uncharacterized protein n=1 Tax=Spironucleus salmonicida TaxID=348837 RepID=V6LJD3_9EUKA|nr:hypothetical protein SS50377_24674 [Spironucleus salmonicida]|eukprot:EST44483.1 Hypothetical protein SS50377_15480 [Spironucleus salmonicida]
MGNCVSNNTIISSLSTDKPISQPSSRVPSLHFVHVQPQQIIPSNIPILEIDFDQSEMPSTQADNDIKLNKFDNSSLNCQLSPISQRIPSVSSHVYSTLAQKIEENDVFSDSDISSDLEEEGYTENKLQDFQSIDWKNLKM